MEKAHCHPRSFLFPIVFFVCILLAAFFSLSMVSSAAYAADISLAWDANSEQGLAGYKLYYRLGSGSDAYNGTGATEGNSPITIYLNDLTNSNSPTYGLSGLGNGVEYSFAVTAFTTDGQESDYSNRVSMTTPLPVVNQTPRASAGADQEVVEGETVYLDGAGSTDPEGALSGYQWRQVSGPTVALTGADSARASFVTPDVGTNGISLSFELQVTDAGGLSAADTCTVNVTWLNNAPTAFAGADRSAIPNELVTLDGSLSADPDGDIISYQWSQKQGPAVSISNPALPSPNFKVPGATASGTAFVFELTVTDAGGLMSTDDCTISIALPIPVVSDSASQSTTGNAGESSNEAPIASAGPDRTAIANEIVTLDGSESYDANDSISVYQWSQKQGPEVNLIRASTESPKFKVPKTAVEGTVYVFELAVTDAFGLTSKDECVVEVIKPFTIASETEAQGGAGDVVDVPAAGGASNEAADNSAGGASGQAEESSSSSDSEGTDQTKTTTADSNAQSDAQSDSNRAPARPVPAVSMESGPLPLPVELAVGGFSDPDAGDSHFKTQWQVYRTADKVCVLNTFTASYLTAFGIPEIILDENTAYFWRARFFDNHGAASEWSEGVGFKTDFSDTDSDGNGIPDDQEVDLSVDMNGDEMPDAQQAVIKSITVPSCGETIGLSVENAGTVTAILSLSAADGIDFAPEDEKIVKQLPYGLINFKLAVDRPGDTAVVTVHFSKPVSSSAKWVKFDPVQGSWIDYSAYAEFSDDGMSVNLEFVDGGFGDDDGVANGIIVDPSGLDSSSGAASFSAETTDALDTVVTAGSDSGGGGGCFITGAVDEATAGGGVPLAAVCMLLLVGAAFAVSSGNRRLS